MPKRFFGRPTTEITMPRWVAWIRLGWGAFITLGAVVVIILWYQAATRDEEADRNARIQACASVYAATYSAWDAEAGNTFGQLIAAAAAQEGDQPVDPALLEGYTNAVGNAAEMAKLRIGLGIYSAESVVDGNDFACPVLPQRLMVEAIRPDQ